MDWNLILGSAESDVFYKDGDVCLIYGDCRSILKKFNTSTKWLDLIVTDPPYEFESRGGGVYKESQNMSEIEEAGTESFDYDSHIPLIINWQHYQMGNVNAYFFCNKSLIPRYLDTADGYNLSYDLLIMNKLRCPPAHNVHYDPDVEYIVFMKSSGAIFNGSLPSVGSTIYSKIHQQQPIGKNIMHPNQKPLDILKKYIMISSNEGGIVMDLFCGSGQTLKAARELGRKSIGIEKNEKFCEIARSNLAQLSFL